MHTPAQKGENHKAWFWQCTAPDKGVIFGFEMTRAREVPREFFKDYGGILQANGYAIYERDVGTKDVTRPSCWAHSRRRFIDALKVQTKGRAADRGLERAVLLMDDLFGIDREVREQNSPFEDRHVLRQAGAPALLRNCGRSF